jgi:type II secretory ATPase GspE/PulE/Tfp pilus assembly ATPase PilB-like protein
MLAADDVLRKALAESPSRDRIEELAVARGMIPLRAEAERLVREGVTTAEEIRRVLG